MRSSILLGLGLLMALGAVACEEDTLSSMPVTPDAGQVLRCTEDTQCASRERCDTRIGVCVPIDACSPPERPCPDPDQVCEDSDGDGDLDCVFERCTDDRECRMLTCDPGLVPYCVAGGCQCGEPCQGGCPGSQGCCIPEDRCYDLPEQCMGMTCAPGQFLSVTSTGAWDTGRCEVRGETCECVRLPPLALGDVGLHSALAHDGRAPAVSAYNLDYGDLMFGRVQPDGLSIDWEFVDGVPTATRTISGDTQGPRGGQGAPGDDVGVYTDLAFDPDGRPHIVYHDKTRRRLRYAVGTGAGWSIHDVDTDGAAGLYASLVIGQGNRPRIAYLAARHEGTGLGRRSSLRLAIASTTTPSRTSDWTIRDVESLNLFSYGCAEECHADEVCRASDLSCVTPEPASRCGGSCPQGTRCVQGSCALIDPLPAFRDLPIARGLWPSIQVEPDGGLLVAYHDRVEGNLKLARVADPAATGAIQRVVVDGAGAGSSDVVGLYPSLHVTPGGEIHLAYMNASRRSLVYRNLAADLSTIIEEEVELGLGQGPTPGGDLIGADPALVVDGSGRVRLAYQNATSGAVRYAIRTGDGQWTRLTLRGDETPYEGSFGFYVDQALLPDRSAALVSTYRYLLSGPPGNGLEVLVTPP